LEILDPFTARKTPMYDIKPPPPDPFEVRVIIWGTGEVTIKDSITEMNDLYVTGHCGVPSSAKQSTDCHYRAKKGKGNFNWRMKFPVALPMKQWPRLRLAIWDRDFLEANDAICEAVIPFKGLCKRALKKKDRVKIYMRGKDRFWMEQLRHPNFEGNQGKLEISIEIMPAAMAAQLPAGLGRSDPNLNPFLPEPEGRLNLSLLHPFDMLKDLLGENLYGKLCGGCCCVALVGLMVLLGPFISTIKDIFLP